VRGRLEFPSSAALAEVDVLGAFAQARDTTDRPAAGSTGEEGRRARRRASRRALGSQTGRGAGAASALEGGLESKKLMFRPSEQGDLTLGNMVTARVASSSATSAGAETDGAGKGEACARVEGDVAVQGGRSMTR